MKKITDFIIEKRHFLLILFIIFTIVSAFLSKNVKINSDISKYLPDDSETRVGNNIMEKEFKNVESSSLNIMFENLSEKEKTTLKKALEDIPHVNSVTYDNSKDYNKGKYTLYVLDVKAKSDSKTSAQVFSTIEDKFTDYTYYTSGSIAESNKTVLPFWIIALAVFCALIILLIMCESYVEPFLFLATILMAVVLNKGTNIIFPSVSHITDSIAAILQMALSMDYSIMLMNRYDQEKKQEKDKVTAMKKALHKAFQSISSSSVTTIVGLLALVFMSFKIGKDLGFILAKGVLFSLICIFFVLPSLILIFDNLITKTKKKSLNFTLNKLGNASYKFRYLSLPIFLLLLGTSFLLKGNLAIDYTDKQADEISKVFKENNQMAIIYSNKDEEKLTKKLKTLENQKAFTEVLAYGNTINEKLPYTKLNQKINDLGNDTTIDDYLLKIIYYNYYNEKTTSRLTFNEFINFLETEAYNNENINKNINSTMKKDVTRLKNFVTPSSINEKHTASEIAQILEIDENNIKDLLTYYLSKNNKDEMTLNEFTNFIYQDVLINEKYSSKIAANTKQKLATLAKFTNKETLNTKMSSSSLGTLFNINSSETSELLKYYLLKNDITLKLDLSTFSNFVLDNILADNNYKDMFDEKTTNNIKTLSLFSDKNLITKQMTSKELSNIFNLEEETIDKIMLLKYLNAENNSKYTLSTFLNYIELIKKNTPYLENLNLNLNLNQNPTNLPLEEDTEYSAFQLATLLNLDSTEVNKIYNLIDYLFTTKDHQMSPQEFVEITLTTNQASLDTATLEQLKLSQLVMGEALKDTTFTYEDLGKFLNIDITSTKKIYVLYLSSVSNIELTPKEFVTFIISNQNAEPLSSIPKNTLNDLKQLNTIMESVLKDTKYDSNSLSNFLGIDKNSTDLLYGLHNFLYNNKNYTISFQDFINFLLDDCLKNAEYAQEFDSEKITKLNTVKTIMDTSLNNYKYSNDEMFAILSNLSNNLEKDMLDVLYAFYGSSKDYDEHYNLTVEEFINYLNNNILKDSKYTDFIDEDMQKEIKDAKKTIKDAKELLIGKNYSRVVLNTNLASEGKKTFKEINNIEKILKKDMPSSYLIGNSPMAYEISKTFDNELNLITIITMLAIFIVVAITFKSFIIPLILVLIIQCAVYLTMGIFTFTNSNVYFISILIVQSILMGATIDYAILYTSYYLEHRKKMSIKASLIESYNKSIHTILTSSSILTIVTLIIASLTTAIAAKICKTISAGTVCSTILILIFLPAILALCDKFIVKKK